MAKPPPFPSLDEFNRVEGGLAQLSPTVDRNSILIRELQGKNNALAAQVAALQALIPSSVTVLPIAPIDGQEVFYNFGTTGMWRLRYSAALNALDGYGWVYLGGAPAEAVGTGGDVTTSTAYITPPTNPGPNVAVPLSGLYLVDSSVEITNNTVDRGGAMSYAIGAAAASDVDRCIGYVPIASGIMSVATRRPKTLVGGDVIAAAIRAVGAGSATLANRYIGLRPQRVKR